MRLIDAENFINNIKLYLDRNTVGETTSQTEINVGELASLLKDEPTAYDIDKVVKEFKKAKTISCDIGFGTIIDTIRKDVALETIKQGYVSNNRKDCEYRHENGNCLKIGGFCTSVNDKYCEKIKQSSVTDNMCEWKKCKNYPFDYIVGCGDGLIAYKQGDYCPYCSKKILCKE